MYAGAENKMIGSGRRAETGGGGDTPTDDGCSEAAFFEHKCVTHVPTESPVLRGIIFEDTSQIQTFLRLPGAP